MATQRPVNLMIIDTSPVNSGGAQLLFRYARYFDPARVRPTMALHEDNLWAERYRAAGTADVLIAHGMPQSSAIPPFHALPLLARKMVTIYSGIDLDDFATPHRGGALRTAYGIPADAPLVGVVGEIYVRCNGYSNGEVIRAIEAAGGEGWLSPMGEWILYTSEIARREALGGTNVFSPFDLAMTLVKDRFLHHEDERIYGLAGPFLADRHEPPVAQVIDAGLKYIPVEFAGESILTMGRAILFARQGARMVVNCAPFGCMPGTLTSSCLQEVQAQTGVPMVSMFYDGDLDLNGRIASYLANLPRAQRSVRDETRVRRGDVGAWA